MKETLSDEQAEAILKALDEAINSGPWDKSNFLKAIGKNLTEIRENFVSHLGARSQAQIKAETHMANRMAIRSGQQEIFISLYSADGSSISSWDRIITNLPRQMISRPIYAKEEHVKELLKTKENKLNEAYVAIYVNQSDILNLSVDKTLVDKLGNALLNLKDKTLDLENISRFVHISGTYEFVHGHLVKSDKKS